MLKTLKDVDIKEKRILLRVAYDITLKNQANIWVVPDDQRIRATIPTINYLLLQNCSIVLVSWLKRPEPGVIKDQFKLDPVAKRLSELIGRPVKKLDATVGKEVESVVQKMQPGEIVMVENTRFNKGEKDADPELAKQMASLGEFVVFDAFAQSHRVHASTTGILDNHINECAAGLLMEKEINIFSDLIKGSIKQPFLVLLGGAKITDKVGMMRNIFSSTGAILIGGALANTFLEAKGFDVGGSLVEGSFVNEAKGESVNPVKTARELIDLAKLQKVNLEFGNLNFLQLPNDVVVAKKIGNGFDASTLRVESVDSPRKLCQEDEAILDIGPQTIGLYSEIIKKSNTIFWNGPMGLFEDENFAGGTESIATTIANSDSFSIVGGGDTESVVTKFNLEGKFSHLSTGGGASLEMLAGQELPVLKYLTK